MTASISGMTRVAIICFRICVPAISTPSRRTLAALIFSSLLPVAHTLLSAVSAISRESSIFSGVTAIVPIPISLVLVSVPTPFPCA